MKAVNKILYILTVVFGLASLVLFFTDFAKIVTDAGTATPVAAQRAFGSKIESAGTTYDMLKSADILLCFILTAVAALIGIFSFKSKKLRYAVPAFGIVTAVYMFVIAISGAWQFVDTRPIELGSITSMVFTPFVWFTAIALAVFTIVSAAYLLVDDYIEVLASKGEKLTIPKRIVRFFRDYKSECKKIVWPGIKEVVKNTVIVLIMCLLVGILIWAVDFGLGNLLDLVWGIKK